jgi:hypothetical protein
LRNDRRTGDTTARGRTILAASTDETVDAAVVLAVDYSGSISEENLALQMRGYANAILSDTFIDAVRAGPRGRIALTLLKWSDARRSEQTVPWIRIDGAPSARAFATALLDSPGPFPGYTSISDAIDASVRLLAAFRLVAARRIIDVSGDGTNNDGRPVTEARDAAVANGITINGLPILGQEPNLEAYYASNVIGGRAAFVQPVTSPEHFTPAVLRKLLTEIS